MPNPEARAELHVFENGEEETFVARDVEDAWDLFLESGGRRSFYEDVDEFWTQVPDDKFITIESTSDHPGGPGSETKTAAEWARDNGRGLLCSTEY